VTTRTNAEVCKPGALSESAQESTGSSQGDHINSGKSASEPVKVKGDRKRSGELRAVRRSASGQTLGAAKLQGKSACPSTPDLTSVPTGDTSTAADTGKRQAAEAQQAPKQAQPQPASQLPGMPVASNGASPHNGMLSYGLHVRLPVCAEGLQLLAQLH
jgi:hypothetical protein